MTLKAAAAEYSERFKLRLDPITRRLICEKCWNQVHGREPRRICKHPACQCLCKDRQQKLAAEVSFWSTSPVLLRCRR